MMGPAMTPGLTPPLLAPSIGAQYCLGHSEHVLSVVSTSKCVVFNPPDSPDHELASLLLAAVAFACRRAGFARNTLVSEGLVFLSPEQLLEGRCPRRVVVVERNHGVKGGERIRGVEGMRVQESMRRSDC